MQKFQTFLAMVPPTVTHNDLVATKGKGGLPYIRKSDRLKAAEDAYLSRLSRVKPREPMMGALKLTITYCFPTGGKHPQGSPMIQKPDADNMDKTLTDCLTRAKIIKDDCLIARRDTTKAWADPAGVFIRVETIESV